MSDTDSMPYASIQSLDQGHGHCHASVDVTGRVLKFSLS